jgi:putative heme iron utilization protein
MHHVYHARNHVLHTVFSKKPLQNTTNTAPEKRAIISERVPKIMSTQHAAPYNPNPPAPIPEPTHAERARTLLHLESIATLSTISRKQAGFPFGSLMPYALDPAGRPLFLISTMAMHTQNLKGDSRASLFVTQPAGDSDVLGAARVTVVGNVLQLAEAEKPEAREIYLKAHPNSQYWVDFTDFAFFRMEPVDVYYVGGFGVMGWVSASEYTAARPDPLSGTAQGIVDHMNADHADALVLLARVHAGFEAESATMTSVDRLGFHVRVQTAAGVKGARIPFSREVLTAGEARTVLVEMVKQARHG